MSVLVEGMEMPKNCRECRFRKTELQEDPDWCLISGESLFYLAENDCPLVPVPPHGRLIDADELGLTDFEIVMCDGSYKKGLEMLAKKIEDAPTIIPAEPPKEER